MQFFPRVQNSERNLRFEDSSVIQVRSGKIQPKINNEKGNNTFLFRRPQLSTQALRAGCLTLLQFGNR